MGRVSGRVGGAVISVSLGADLNGIKVHSRLLFERIVECLECYGKKHLSICGKLGYTAFLEQCI